MNTELFRCPLTFMGVPYSHDLSAAKAAIVGIPFDVGTDASRVGARHGPEAIRIQSGRQGAYFPPHADEHVLQALGVVDCGDAQLIPSYLGEAQVAIEAAVKSVLATDTVPFTMGGDGTVTLPQLRAVANRYPDLVVLHIDAHTDTVFGDGRAFATGTTFTHAAQEGLVDVNTVSPPHDSSGITAMLAARVLYGFMLNLWHRMQETQDRPSP